MYSENKKKCNIPLKKDKKEPKRKAPRKNTAARCKEQAVMVS